MILEVVQSKWSLTWYDPLGPRMCVLELMNGHVLQTLREQLKVPGSRLEGSELLTSEFSDKQLKVPGSRLEGSELLTSESSDNTFSATLFQKTS